MHSPDPQGLPGTELLRLARTSIEYGLIHGEPVPIDYARLSRELSVTGATFTTVRLEGALRGCSGTLDAVLPLAEDVTRSAFHAAFRDPRFEPVGERELDASGACTRMAPLASSERNLTACAASSSTTTNLPSGSCTTPEGS